MTEPAPRTRRTRPVVSQPAPSEQKSAPAAPQVTRSDEKSETETRKNECLVPGCDESPEWRGLCAAHRQTHRGLAGDKDPKPGERDG